VAAGNLTFSIFLIERSIKGILQKGCRFLVRKAFVIISWANRELFGGRFAYAGESQMIKTINLSINQIL